METTTDEEILKLWQDLHFEEFEKMNDLDDIAEDKYKDIAAIRLYRLAERSKKPNYCDMEKAAYENHKAFHPDGTTHICYFCDCEEQTRASAVIDWLESEEAVGLVEPEYDDERCLTEVALERAFKKVAAKLREKKKKED